MKKAVIFDMDGLLIDSEPLWRKAEIAGFAEVGLRLTDDDCRETMGFRLDEVVDLWYLRQPWNGPSKRDVENDILHRVVDLIRRDGEPLPGVHEAVALCVARGRKIAVASSSPLMLIRTVVEKLGLTEVFDALCSTENEPYGKPHPAVFLLAARTLDVDPVNCTVLEDSIHGMVAGLAAKMRVIVVPEPGLRKHPAWGAADQVLGSLTELEAHMV
ncbi:MAG TPA: hexitol phosphatase HxpB [Cryomorphaceae bacterium]|nr:hexitol phosphatase HxpB [Cryomorphaceae bacterium]